MCPVAISSGDDPEPLAHDPAHERRGEEAVLAAEQEARRHVGHRLQRPRRVHRRAGLADLVAHRLLGERVRHVVEPGGEIGRVARSGAGVAGVRPPLAGRLARRGHHRLQQDEQVDRDALADQRRGEPAERVRDEHDPLAVADRLRDRVRVLRQAGGVVLGGQVDGDEVVAAGAQLAREQVPVPGVAAGAGDRDEGAHGADDDRRRGKSSRALTTRRFLTTVR